MRRPLWIALLALGLSISPVLSQTLPTEVAAIQEKARKLRTDGKIAEAIPLYQQVLSFQERNRGTDSPEVAALCAVLGSLFTNQGNYPAAETNFLRAIKIQEQLQNPLKLADYLNSLANLYRDQTKFDLAEPLYQRVLLLRQANLDPKHPDMAKIFNNIGILNYQKGNYLQAETFYLKALMIRENALGLEHPDVATSLNNLGVLYSIQGRYAQAEPLYLRVLKIWEKEFGPDQPDTAIAIINLANIYKSQGNYRQAQPLYLRALTIFQKSLGPNHPDLAAIYYNLGGIAHEQNQLKLARTYFEKSLAISQKAYGLEHPDVAQTSNELAGVLLQQGQVNQGEQLYQTALRIARKTLGLSHPLDAEIMVNLGNYYQKQKRFNEAKILYQKALQLQEKSLGMSHPQVGQTYFQLASLHRDQGQFSLATQALERAASIEEYNLNLNLARGSELQKTDYLKILNQTLNFALTLPSNPALDRLVLTTLLRRKGRVLDTFTNNLALLRRKLNPADQQLLTDWSTTRTHLANLIYQGPGLEPLEQYRAQIDQLNTQTEQYEKRLNDRSAEFQNQNQEITLSKVQQLVEPGSILLEFTRYQPLSGPACYRVYLLGADTAPRAIDLGSAPTLEAQIKSFRRVLRDRQVSRSELKAVAQNLEIQLMAPLYSVIGDKRQILISPDSELNLIPFAALVNRQGNYLIEDFNFTYLSSGRDLLRFQTPSPPSEPPLILANPDFDSPSPSSGSGSERSMRFGPLPGTALEATAIALLLPNAQIRTGKAANEELLRKAHGPKILHLATHGFFLKDKQSVANPLLRSGLALAGFNARQDGKDDGVLTALEVAGLDLQGTQLATLSACETGLGEILNGEGVYGLRRALVLAGAQTQVISLWKVSDEGTKDLMVAFYQNLEQGLGRSASLRAAQLKLLKEPRYQHPYYWAAFIPSGNSRPLSE